MYPVIRRLPERVRWTGVFITTTGVGEILDGVSTSGDYAKPGDAIIVTGDIGRHGCTILLAREDFGIDADVTSDCAPLWPTVESVLNATKDVHVIRDATRGGVGTVLYEIAGQSKVGIRLNAADVPVAPEVKGVCGMLGLEPLYLACEGRLVIMAPKSEAEKIVEVLRQCPYSKDAAIIGEVTEEQPGHVVMTTEIGTQAFASSAGRRAASENLLTVTDRRVIEIRTEGQNFDLVIADENGVNMEQKNGNESGSHCDYYRRWQFSTGSE